MIKIIVYDENKFIGVNPTSICKVFLKRFEEGNEGNLHLEFNNKSEKVIIPRVDFKVAREIIDFLNNPEQFLYSVQ